MGNHKVSEFGKVPQGRMPRREGWLPIGLDGYKRSVMLTGGG